MPHVLRDAHGQVVDGYQGLSVDEDPSWFGGWDRLPRGIVENEEDIWSVFTDTTATQPTLTCGYCGDKLRTMAPSKAIRWFHAHDCPAQQTAEAEAMVYSLTPMLTAAA